MPIKNVTCVTAELGLNTECIRSPTVFTSMLSSTSGLWVLNTHTQTPDSLNQVQVFVWCTWSKSWLDYRLGCVQPKSTSSTKLFTALSIYIIMSYQKPAVTRCNESKCLKQIAKICWNYKCLEPQSSLIKTKVKSFGLDLSQKPVVLPQIKMICLLIAKATFHWSSYNLVHIPATARPLWGHNVQMLMLKFSRYRSFCF